MFCLSFTPRPDVAREGPSGSYGVDPSRREFVSRGLCLEDEGSKDKEVLHFTYLVLDLSMTVN